MKIDHLNFAELLKLSSTKNICALTAKYHTDLRAEWDRFFRGGFRVSEAEWRFPDVVRLHKPDIDFLNGPEVKARLRYLADHTSVPRGTGEYHTVRVCEHYTAGQATTAGNLAGICNLFLYRCGLTGRFNVIDGAIQVQAQTTSLGVSILIHRSGIEVRELREYCDKWKLDFEGIFWWLSHVTVSLTGRKINPLLRCLNTPDVVAHANSLVN